VATAALRRVQPDVLVRCPSCGGERSLSSRHRHSTAPCAGCRFPRPPTTDVERAWWLHNFDDETIAAIAEALFGFGDAYAVGSWRARLLGGIKRGSN
jgi:hypothetical protein